VATLLSKPVNIVVQPASTSAQGWGDGADTGSLAGDAWTPGRNAAGAVNAASWNTVPLNRWVQVAGTRLDALDAAVKAAIPGWKDYGVEGWAGVTDDWCGFAIDTAGSRLWLMGGGHAGSSNNGVYRFDALKMAWAIEDLPSDPAPWSASYKASGNYGYCAESHTQFQGKVANSTLQPVNDWYRDELFWDRKPAARHTYSSMVYVPESNELVMAHRRLWRYSLTQRQWTYRRLIRDQAADYMDAENGVAIYDESTREVLVSSAGSLGIYRATGYSLTQNQWTNWSSPWNLYSGIADVRVGRRIVVMLPPQLKNTPYGSPNGIYWDYDLDTRTVKSKNGFQFADGLSSADFAPDNWYYDSPALAYIPSRNRYWLYTLMNVGGMALMEVDPTTTPWTIRRAPPMAGAFPVPGKNLERKMIFLPALNAVVLCDSAKKDMAIYRF
jgi:hypothetical protein